MTGEASEEPASDPTKGARRKLKTPPSAAANQ